MTSIVYFVVSVGYNTDANELVIHCLKNVHTFKLSVTLSNICRFSNFLHCWKAYEICYKIHTILATSP